MEKSALHDRSELNLSDVCIVIPAINKRAFLPDQYIKKLIGITLIQRAIDTCAKVLPKENIFVVTDSEEVSLIAQRSKVQSLFDRDLDVDPANLLVEAKKSFIDPVLHCSHIVIYHPVTPFVDETHIVSAFKQYLEAGADLLVSLKLESHKIWRKENGDWELTDINKLKKAESFYSEVQAFRIFNREALSTKANGLSVTPYILNDNGIEIASYQDWWICEKLLMRKRIVFVVRGGGANGLGHVFRALLIAHEITDHQILFVCTRESGIAAEIIAEKDYQVLIQKNENLADDVLSLKPDLVINDILNTDAAYMEALSSSFTKIVCFEDEGEGAGHADLIVNALYDNFGEVPDNFLYGHDYFCLRDEFLGGRKRSFVEEVRCLLLTFGGIDPNNFTRKSLEVVWPVCQKLDIKIYIVTGPGYLYKENLRQYLDSIAYKNIEFIYVTNIMSHVMENVDIAISSAGRTVYELAYMHIPAVVMAHHEREYRHSFAMEENGFINIGIMDPFSGVKLKIGFEKLLNNDYRKSLQEKFSKFNFEKNKHNVVRRITGLLS